MRFTEILDRLLFEKHMTRSDLARALNIPPSTINSWFNRGYEGVQLKTLIAIANYFNVSLDYLILGKQDTTVTVDNNSFTTEEIATLKRIITYADKLKGL